MIDTALHPCFNKSAAKSYGRVHLPVAPACNVQCNFCNRDYDCVNESRPGVCSTILSPGQAEWFFNRVSAEVPVSVAGIAGPGDPFAEPEVTLETFRLIRKSNPDAILCVSSNGLNLLPSVKELARLEVSHVTVTVNAIRADIGAKIYQWIRVGKKVFRGEEGATLLLENQLAAIASLKARGITVKVNSIVIPGVNDFHIAGIAKEMKKRRVDLFNCIPMIPVPGAVFENLEEPDHDLMWEIKEEAGESLPQMKHCQRCRADAVGLLADKGNSWQGLMREAGRKSLFPDEHRPYIAAASREGYLVNQHLGEADVLGVYAKGEDGRIELVEKRITPAPGSGDSRWSALADSFSDCKAVLVNGSGERPRRILESKGLKVHRIEGFLDDAVSRLFEGQSLDSMSCRAEGCGSCSGKGVGCG